MALRFTDIMKTVAPIGLSFIPGVGIPAAIAMSAALRGGISAAEGGSMGEILRDSALGAASGAGGAAIGGAISKGLGGAAEAATGKAAKKATEKVVGEAMGKGGLNIGFGGLPQVPLGAVSEGGWQAAGDIIGKGAARQAMYQKGADLTSGALGKNPKETEAMLKTIKSGGQVVGAVDDAARMMNQPQRFSQQHAAMMQHPGMDERYQFGSYGSRPRSSVALGFGRFY